MANSVARHYAPGTFGAYLQQHGYGGPSKLPLEVRALARRFSERPHTIAPNSPMLPGFAAVLKVPLDELQAFAKKPPLAEKWVKKIQAQLDRGTVPRGAQHAKAMRRAAKRSSRGVVLGAVTVAGRRVPPRSPSRVGAGGPLPVAGSFLRFVEKHSDYATLVELAKAAKVRNGVVWLLNTSGKVAKDSPNLERLATALKVPLGAVARFAKGAPSAGTGNHARQLRTLEREDHRRTGKAVVHVPKPAAGDDDHEEPKRGYNRLKKHEVALRQAARDMVTSLNVSVMQGQKFTQPMPVAVLHAVLLDYLGEKGLKGNVLVDPRFAEFFDRS